MEPEDYFTQKELKCPECEEISLTKEWDTCLVACDDCGDHSGIECPKCGEQFDSVWGIDKIRNVN